MPYDAPLPAGPPTLAERLTARGIHAAGFVANGMAGASFGLDRGFAEFHEIYRDQGSRAGAFLQVLPAFFRENKDRRFFAYAHVREPHFPYDPAAPFDTRFGPDGPLTMDERRSAVWYTAVNARKVARTPEQEAHLVRLYDGNLAYADHVVGAAEQPGMGLDLLRMQLAKFLRVRIVARGVKVVAGTRSSTKPRATAS